MNEQHRHIKGYRDLDEHDIAITNHIKGMEENCRVFLNSLHEPLKTADPEALRWLAIARTHLETGFMYAIKAVTRPANGLGRSNADNRTLEEIRAENLPVEDAQADHSD